MPADYSPPDSPLSSVETDEGSGDDGHDYDEAARRPSKRQRLDAGSTTSSAVVPDAEPETVPEPDTIEGLSDVSSDTSGDIPSSPVNARLDDEDFQDQVTVCDWDGCPAGDLRDMDKLVEHIHNSHIENRQKKYTCEWRSCNRKGLPHASGYALKAHMRSHTREKPFYCYLPECDRSFTRSDALAKHMRTVHETEALRPSDPVPKSMQSGPTGKTGRLKIIIKTPQSHGQQDDDENGHGDETNPEYFTVLSEEIFDTEELAMPVDKLYRKSHWELKWAEEINESLKKECRELEAAYFKEWLEKEVLLSQVIKSEVDWHERRQAILTGLADVQVPKASEARDLDASAAAPTQTNGGDGEKKKSREREDDDEDEDEGRKEDKAEPLANGGKAASEVKAETQGAKPTVGWFLYREKTKSPERQATWDDESKYDTVSEDWTVSPVNGGKAAQEVKVKTQGVGHKVDWFPSRDMKKLQERTEDDDETVVDETEKEDKAKPFANGGKTASKFKTKTQGAMPKMGWFPHIRRWKP